jgi:hypothetical protein
MSHVVPENERKNTKDQKTRFNLGTNVRDGRKFGPSDGRRRGDGSCGKQFNPSRGDARDGTKFGHLVVGGEEEIPIKVVEEVP